jgi:sigma-E factor negative regulatory protein RseC
MNDPGKTVINHDGIVKENSGKSVIISISSSSACSGCHAKGSCGSLGNEEKMVIVDGSYNVKPGDHVTVMMMQSMGFRALFLGYVLPFILVIALLAILVSRGYTELTAGASAIASLIPYYLLLFFFRKKTSAETEF